VLRSISSITLAAVVSSGLFLALAACGAPPQKMVAVTKDDGVPANSASEQRLAMEGKTKPAAPQPSDDLAQPLTTPLTADPAATAPATTAGSDNGSSATANVKGGKGGKGPKDAKGPKEVKDPKGGGGGKVSRAECKQTFDKYIDLTLASDSRFEGIPPEMIAQLKEQALSQAQSQKGDPCSTQDVTREQYKCAMTAPTTAAWQRCMK
jgi:hypothetical protein